MSICPTETPQYKRLKGLVGEKTAHKIVNVNIKNGEDSGNIEDHPNFEKVTKQLIENKIVPDLNTATILYSLAYTNEFQENFNIDSPRKVTYKMLTQEYSQSLDVYTSMSSSEIKDVLDLFYFSALYNLEDYTMLDKLNFANLDNVLTSIKNYNNVLLLAKAIVYENKYTKEQAISAFNLSQNTGLISQLDNAINFAKSTKQEVFDANLKERFKRLELVNRNKEYFISKTKEKLKSDGINFSKTILDNEDGVNNENENLEETLESSGVIAKSSYEVSSKQNASAQVKAFFKTIPKVEKYQNGKPVFDTKTYLGTPKMFMDAYNFVLKKANNKIQKKNPDGTLSDPISEIVSELEKEGVYEPTYLFIADKIKNAPQNFKTQLFNSMSMYKSNNKDTLININYVNNNRVIEAKLINSEFLGDALTIRRSWLTNFNSKFTKFLNTDLIYNEEDFVANFSHILGNKGILMEVVSDAIAGNRESVLTTLSKVLNNLGLQVNNEVVERVISKEEGENFSEKSRSFITSLGAFIRTLENTVKAKEINDDIFTNDNVVNKLSEAYIDANAIPETLSIRGPEGNRRYSYENFNVLTLLIERLNQGDLEHFHKIQEGPMQQYSYLLANILENKDNIQSRMKVAGYGNFKRQNKQDSGEKFSNLKESEKFIDTLVKYYNGIWVGLAEADKSSQFYLENPMKFISSKIDNYELTGNPIAPVRAKFTKNSNTHKVLINYLKAETNRIRVETKRVKLLEDNEKIQFYHYKKDPSKNDGNAFTYIYFQGLTVENLNSLLGEDVNILDENFTIENINLENEELYQFLTEVYNNLLNETLKEAIDIGIINFKPTGSLENVAIPDNIISQKGNIVNAIDGYVLNSLVANMEMTMLFNMDVALYKSKAKNIQAIDSVESLMSAWEDFAKRIPAISAPGKVPLVYSDNLVTINPTYTSAVAKDITVDSKTITDTVKQNIAEKLGIPIKEVEKELAAYGKIDLVDAQAWITLDLWKQRIASNYGWSQNMENVFNRLKNNQYTWEDLKVLSSVPIKTTHVEILNHPRTDLGSLPMMVYNKQSEFPIIPGLTNELDKLLGIMEANQTDHLIAESGRKVGGIGLADISNLDNVNLTNLTLDTRHALMQQEVKSKGKKDFLVPSQPTKNIIALLSETTNYSKELTGRDMFNIINEVIANLSDKGKQSILKELGVGENEIVNEYNISQFFSKILKGEVSDASLAALKAGTPIEAVLEAKNKIESKFLAFIKKSTVSLKQFGGVAVQTSSFGFSVQGKLTKDVKSNIKWFKDTQDLSAMKLVRNEDGTFRTEKAQVLLSHDSLDKIFRTLGLDLNEMSAEEIKASLSPELLEGVAYRIPNQGPGSNDAFEIVGLLPPGMGDVMVLYDEITKKTGSDFDIDKVFFMLSKPNGKDVLNYSEIFKNIQKDTGIKFNTIKEISDLLNKGETILAEEVANNVGISLKEAQDLLKNYKLNYLQKNPIKSYRTDKPVSEMSKEELQQKRLDIYSEILQHPDNYLEVMRPLDTPWLDDLYEKDLLENEKAFAINGEKIIGKPLFDISGIKQFKNKSIFDSAKNLVGVVANHMTHFGLLKMENVFFNNYYLGVGHRTGTDTLLSNTVDVEGNSISETFVAFMNAIVDAAKDPKIIKMNVNQLTSPTVFMLARAGVSREFLMYFINQPILKDYTKFINASEGRLADTSKTALDKIFEKYGKPGLSDISRIPGIRSNYLQSIEHELPINVLLNNIQKPNSANKTLQLSILKQFLEWQDKAKKLNDLIRVTKVDVEGGGKSLNSARIKYQAIVNMLEDDTFNKEGISELLGLELDVEGKIVYKGTNVVPLDFLEDVLENEITDKPVFTYKGVSIETQFVLNEEQDKALKGLIDFMNNPNEKIITLQGPAGTGKTSVIGYLDKYLKKSNSYISTMYLAPTHAATVQLAFATAKAGNKNFPFTVKSSLYKDFRNKIATFTNKAKKLASPFGDNLIIVDEVSLVENEELDLISDISKNSALGNNKFILMGDRFQLAEIDKNTKASTKPVSKAFTDFNQIELTKVMRTDNNAILSVLNSFRENNKKVIYKIKENTDNLQYLQSGKFNTKIKDTFLKDPNNTVIISYTNKSVQNYNSSIRSIFKNSGSPKIGEIAVGYLGYQSKQILNGNLANAVRYQISDVVSDGSVKHIKLHSQQLSELIGLGVNLKSEYANTTYYQLSENDSFNFEDLTRQDFQKNNKEIASIFEKLHKAFVNAEKNNYRGAAYVNLKNVQEEVSFAFASIDLGNDYIYDYRTNSMVLENSLQGQELKKIKNYSSYFTIKKGVDYGYAITVHKSQGMTVDNVFYDPSSTLSAPDLDLTYKGDKFSSEFNALNYVATSRASKSLTVLEADSSMFEEVETVTAENQEILDTEIKQGVPELFETNTELANSVYESLGFGQETVLNKLLPKNELYYSETETIKKDLKNSEYSFLIPIVDNLKIKFAYNSGLDDFGMAGSTDTTGNIMIHPKHKTNDLIAHEIVHGAIKKLQGIKGEIVINKYDNISTDYKEFRKEADTLADNIIQSLKEYRKVQQNDSLWAKRLDKWLEHIEYSGKEEVITFALTDKNFQKILKELPSTYTKKTNNKSAWNDFLSLIEKFLQIFKLEKTQLNSIVDLLEDYIPTNNQITPQQEQQAQQIYSQYLDTIFPDSKVKDIVYHTSLTRNIDKFKDSPYGIHFGTIKAGIDRILGLQYSGSILDGGLSKTEIARYIQEARENLATSEFDENGNLDTNLATEEEAVKYISKSYPTLLNISDIKTTDDLGDDAQWESKLKNLKFNEGFRYKNRNEDIGNESYVVKESEQTYILGSKQDIEGFKEFINEPTKSQISEENNLEETPSKTVVPNKKMMAAYIMNSIGFLNDNVVPITLETTQTVFNSATYTLSMLEKDFTSEELIDLTTRELGSSIKGTLDILSGNSLEDFREVHSFLADKANKSLVDSNIILRDIVKPVYDTIKNNNNKKIRVPQIEVINKNIDVENVTLIHKAWEDLFKANPEFTRTLIRTLFHSSGFTYSRNNFYELISPKVLNELGYVNLIMSEMEDNMENDVLFSNIEKVIQNNFSESKLISEVKRPNVPSVNATGIEAGFFNMSLEDLDKQGYLKGETAPVYLTYNNNLYKHVSTKIDDTGNSKYYYGKMNSLGVKGNLTTTKEYFDIEESKARNIEAIKNLNQAGFNSKQISIILAHLGEFSAYGTLNNVFKFNSPLNPGQIKFLNTLLKLKSQSLNTNTVIYSKFEKINQIVSIHQIEETINFCK